MSRLEELCILAAALAGVAMYGLNRQWPDHPISFPEFLLLWLIALIAVFGLMTIWRRRGRP
jgi:hypothetical protein